MTIDPTSPAFVSSRFLRVLLVEPDYAVQHIERHVFERPGGRVGSDYQPSECLADIAIKLGRDHFGRPMNMVPYVVLRRVVPAHRA